MRIRVHLWASTRRLLGSTPVRSDICRIALAATWNNGCAASTPWAWTQDCALYLSGVRSRFPVAGDESLLPRLLPLLIPLLVFRAVLIHL